MLSISSTSRMVFRQIGKQAVQAVTARYLTSSLPMLKQHLVIALGGNAMLKRGEKATIANQQKNIADGVSSLVNVVNDNTVTIVHGNGPQVGLLMLESASYEKQTGLEQMSLDVLDAETEGMLGYLIEQELQPYIDKDRGMVTVLSQIVCDPNDPSMSHPTKFVGPVLTKEEADKLTVPIKPDGTHFRRVVPSPLPVRLVDSQMQAVQQLTKSDCVVICAGGGGIPVIEDPDRNGKYKGIEAVIDKDRAATMMGCALGADGLLILTDVPAVATDFGTPQEKYIKSVAPKTLKALMGHFPAGSMGPKVEAAIDFVEKSGGWAAIGSLTEAEQVVAGEAGTIIHGEPNEDFIEYYDDRHDDLLVG